MITPALHDVDGQARTWVWLLDTFGDVDYLPAEVKPGQEVYRVVRLRAGLTGTLLTALVLQPDGRPQPGVCVVRHWPDAPLLRVPELPVCAPATDLAAHLLPPERGVAARTGPDGLVAFSTGPEDVYLPPNAGTSTLYVRDPAVPSDLMGGLGVLRAGALRICLHITWQRIRTGTDDRAPGMPSASPLTRLATGQALILDLLCQIARRIGLEP
jgi:hypothetical protein